MVPVAPQMDQDNRACQEIQVLPQAAHTTAIVLALQAWVADPITQVAVVQVQVLTETAHQVRALLAVLAVQV